MDLIHIDIDVSSKTLDVCVPGEEGHAHWKLPNDPSGHATLLERIGEKATRVRVAMEATGVYHLHLACVSGVMRKWFFVRFGDPLGERGSDVRGNELSPGAGVSRRSSTSGE